MVYEYRYWWGDHPRVRRWAIDAIPLRVYFDERWTSAYIEDLWFGTRAWEDIVSPGVPSFVRVDDPDDADVVWVTSMDPERGSCATWNRFEELPTIAHTTIECGPGGIREEHSLGSRALATHETGHALGLVHSHRPKDMMGSGSNWFSGLTEGDIRTLRVLYAAEPTY